MMRAKRAICEPMKRQTVDSSTSLCKVCKTLQNDAVESTLRHHNGSQIARLTHSMRTPFGAFAWCA
eukprot:6881745-Lingulodinium_polyedra.AAC.1